MDFPYIIQPFSNEVNQVEMRNSESTYAECLALITFTDDLATEEIEQGLTL